MIGISRFKRKKSRGSEGAFCCTLHDGRAVKFSVDLLLGRLVQGSRSAYPAPKYKTQALNTTNFGTLLALET